MLGGAKWQVNALPGLETPLKSDIHLGAGARMFSLELGERVENFSCDYYGKGFHREMVGKLEHDGSTGSDCKRQKNRVQ